MLLKSFVVFGLFLSCVFHAYADTSTENKIVFCDYDWGDWYGYSEYDEASDTIHIENCAWGMGYRCNEYKINKIMDQDGIKVYCDNKHKNIFINDNGFWRWENPGCDKQDLIPTDLLDNPDELDKHLDKIFAKEIAHSLRDYAFKHTCSYKIPEKTKQLLIIDKKYKIYVINRTTKTTEVFSAEDNPVIYPSDPNEVLKVNEKICK
jgi:hypothetical protein